MQIQISWLPQKPTDLDLHCLQRQGISRFSRQGLIICTFVHVLSGDDTCSSGSNDDLIEGTDGDLEEGMSTVQVLPTTVCSVSTFHIYLNHCRLNRLSHTIYLKCPFLILDTFIIMSGYMMLIFLKKNG